MNLDLTDRVVVITGGGGFLGLEFGRALAQAGAHPVLADVHEEGAIANADLLAGEGLHSTAMRVDLTDAGGVGSFVDEVIRQLGRLDGLLNAAAIDPKFDTGSPSGHTGAFEDYPLALWQASLDVNLTGTFLVTQAAARHFIAQDRGVIVNVASIYGEVGPDQRLYSDDERLPPPRFKPVDYSVTKSALYGFTRYLAAYFAGSNIRVNAVTFGGINRDHDDGFRLRYARRVPMGRMGEPSEVGGVVVFLFSDASSYMTGSNVVVDGGWTAW